MPTRFRNGWQSEGGSNEPGWMLLCLTLALVLCLAGLPWIIVGWVAQRFLARWLHWRVSFLLWLLLLFIGAYLLYMAYQHGGLEILFQRALTDYLLAIKQKQYHLEAYPLRHLWAETWPVWLQTWPGIGVAGFVGELYDNRNDTARTLRQQERKRGRAIARAQQHAKKRARRPERIADIVGKAMVIGVPIKDLEQE